MIEHLTSPLTLEEGIQRMDSNGYLTGTVAVPLEDLLKARELNVDSLEFDTLMGLLIEEAFFVGGSYKVLDVKDDGETLIVEVTTDLNEYFRMTQES